MKSDDNSPLTITRAWLDQHDACKDQADLFEKTWPEGVVVTQETLTSAARAGLRLDWFAEQVLLPSIHDEYLAKYAPINAEYVAKSSALYADYLAKVTSLHGYYKMKRDLLLFDYLGNQNIVAADHRTKHEMLYANYLAGRAPLDTDYETKRALLAANYQAKRNVLLIAALGTAKE